MKFFHAGSRVARAATRPIEQPYRALALTMAACSLAVVVPGTRADEPPPLPPALTLEWCLARAKSANPSLDVARALAEAAEHRVRPAGALDDPRFSYEASNIPVGDFDFDSTPLSGHQFGIRQKFFFPGERSSRKRAAASLASALSHTFDDEALSIDAAVEAAWAEQGFAERALDITERNIELLRQLASTAETQYRVGSGIQHDVLRARVELTALLQERLQRREALESSTARLVALLDLPAATHLPPTSELDPPQSPPTLEPILADLERNSPRIAAARERVESARHGARAAELEGRPDIDFGLGYRARREVPGDRVNGDDFVSAGFTIRLPVDRARWRARAAEQQALERHAKAELRSIRAQLASRVRTAHARLVRASSEQELLRSGLVPQARQSLASSRSAYKVGRIEFASLLDSQVRLLQAELRLARAAADTHQAYAALESSAGEKLR